MPNFTPGPWVVEKDNLHPFFYVSKEKSKTFLATVNNEANARLIAADPVMYEATVALWHILIFLLAIVPDELKKDIPEKIANVEKLLNRIHGAEDHE